MQKINFNLLKYKNPTTGEFENLHAFVGKSAYETAKEGGFTGTEEEFATLLANQGQAQIQPLFMDSMEELEANGDTSKLYILPDNFIYAYREVADSKPAYTNLVEPIPENTTDTLKWVNGYRFGSGGITSEAGTTISNLIRCKNGDIIRIKGVILRENVDRVGIYWGEPITTLDYQGAIDYFNRGVLTTSNASLTYIGLEDGVYSFQAADGGKEVIGVRFAMPTPADASQVIVTVNEEITENSGSSVGYTNQIPISTDASGNVVGLIEGHRYNSSDTLVEQTGVNATGFIPAKQNDTVYFQNVLFGANATHAGSVYLRVYDSSYKQLGGSNGLMTYISQVSTTYTVDENQNLTSMVLNGSEVAGCAYIRMSFDTNGEEAIITVNEPIEGTTSSGGYTNLFDTSGSGFKDETTKFYTNWLPYNQLDNGGTGTIYHFKGLSNSDPTYQNPYKMQFATDSNGSGASAQSYCANANVQKTTVASYDSSVMLVQHNTKSDVYKYVQFEIREALPSDLIITANEDIIGEPIKPSGYKNLADTSSADWGEDTRMKDSGDLSAVQGRRTSNFIPCSKGDAIHVKGINVLETAYPASAVAVFDSSKTWLGGFSISANTNTNIVGVSSYDENVIVVNPSVYLTDAKYDNMAYVRLCGGTVGDKNDCVITVNENIVESGNTGTSKAWTNTGHAFIPTEYDSQIATLTNKTNANAAGINTLANTTSKQSKDIATLQTSVKNLESGKTNTSLPTYWEEYLPSKIATIKALQEAGGKDCFSFPLLTDIHITVNQGKRSGILAKRIMDECNMKYAVCCGDVITRGANKTKEQTEQNYASVEELLAPIRPQLLQTQGNHDGSWGQVDLDGDGDVEGEEYYCFNYTPQLNYERIYRKVGLVGDVHFDKSGSGYWIDDVSNKVRYIGMNSHCNKYEENADGTAVYNNMRVFRLTQSQFDMTIEALTTVPSDEWAVVSFSHAPLNNRDGNMFADRIVMRDMLNAYRNKTSYKGTYGTSGNYDYVTVDVNFANAKGQYVAHFSGHTHTDTVTTDFGIPIITTRCDGKEENDATLNAEKVLGTVTEQSFDIFTVNKATGKIYATKIGAGDDRIINYELIKDETPTYTNALANALGRDGVILNRIGYIDGYYLTGNPSIGNYDMPQASYLSTDATHFTTGYMPYNNAQAIAQTPIYIKGVTIDTTQSHTRLGVFPSLEYANYIEQMRASYWSSYLTLETLGDKYYKLTPNASFSDYFSGSTQSSYAFTDYSYIRFSLQGSGDGVIISIGKEITD